METTQKKAATPDFKITGDWKSISEKLKAKYTQLTSEDLEFQAGKENELLTRISTRLGKRNDEIVQLIKKAEKDETF